MKKINAYTIMKDLKGQRIAGTMSEQKSIKTILSYLKQLKIKPTIQEFPIHISHTEFSTIHIEKYKIKCLPYGLTVPFNISGKFLFLKNKHDYQSIDNNLKNKIIYIRNKPSVKDYKILKKKGVKGIITSLRTDGRIASLHLNEKMIKEKIIIPTVDISFEDAIKLKNLNNKKIKINGKGQTLKTKGNNIIINLKGTVNTNETIIIMGHYDTVPHSPGASDNSGGIGIIMELINYFSKYPISRNLIFALFSGEEWGLVGSRAFCNKYKKQLDNIILGINIDVAGDMLGFNYCNIIGNNNLFNTINNINKFYGMGFTVKNDIFSSDNMPFSYMGIPTLSLYRAGGRPSSYIHTVNDEIKFIDKDSLNNIIDFSTYLIKYIGNAKINLIDKEINNDIKQKTIDYFKNRGLKEKDIVK